MTLNRTTAHYPGHDGLRRSAMISARGSTTFRTMEHGVLFSIAMGEGLGGGDGAGERRCIVYRGDIGIGMELSIRRNFGMITFMGSIGIEGDTQVGKNVAERNGEK